MRTSSEILRLLTVFVMSRDTGLDVVEVDTVCFVGGCLYLAGLVLADDLDIRQDAESGYGESAQS